MIRIIKDGGYATSITYVDKLCQIIERWNLTQYDLKQEVSKPETQKPEQPDKTIYRVRKDWGDASSQIGAFMNLDYAKACADENPGTSVFDGNGIKVYPEGAAFVPYLVRVSVDDLNIRKEPTAESGSLGYTGKGTFTIVEEKDGWGLLKAYADNRNGWIYLKFAERA